MGLNQSHDAALETVDSTALRGAREQNDDRARARLSLVFPLDVNFVADLGAERLVIGRQPPEAGSIQLNHQTVSRAHFEIDWDPELGQHVGRDLGSRNGSWLGGAALGGAWEALEDGTVLRIGDVILVYESEHTLKHPSSAEVSRESVPGEAISVRALRTQLSRAAPDVSPVLIIGETGTGKELIAREIHRLSERSGEFIAINCSTLGEQLIESQLFGHVKGAFTGATTDQQGLFRAAEGGTLFLDEIGEMPKELQPKLLRAIQEREIRAVGSTHSERVDVRVIAATHQDLEEQARDGTFRQDLYARLALWRVDVPSVRQRRADVLSWLQLLYRLWRSERGLEVGKPLKVDADAADVLTRASWPENLRGLNRLVHELASRESTSTIRKRDLPAWIEVDA